LHSPKPVWYQFGMAGVVGDASPPVHHVCRLIKRHQSFVRLVGHSVCLLGVFAQAGNSANSSRLGWSYLLLRLDISGWDKAPSVSETSHAILYDAHGPSDRRRGNETISKEGTWSFDEISKRYLVVLNGETTTYLLVSPEGGGMCMLIAGDVQSADLRQSWFSSLADDNHEPNDQGTGPDDR
jgi:hypothetical protein